MALEEAGVGVCFVLVPEEEDVDVGVVDAVLVRGEVVAMEEVAIEPVPVPRLADRSAIPAPLALTAERPLDSPDPSVVVVVVVVAPAPSLAATGELGRLVETGADVPVWRGGVVT